MTLTDWENITNYIDTVGTTLKTFTFKKPQDYVKVTIKGTANVTYTIGTKTGTLTPGQSITVSEIIWSFTLTSVSGTQQIEVYAKEANTEKEEDTSNDVMSQLAQTVNYYPPNDLQSQILWRNKSTLLHDFQTDIQPNHGTVEYDATVKFSGSRSCKITTNPATYYAIGRIDLGATGVDLSNSHLMMMVRHLSTSASVSDIRLQLWGDGFVNLGYWVRTYGGNTNLSKDDWEIVTFSGGSGNPLTQNVRYVDITVGTSSTTNTATMYFNQLRKFEKTSKGYVTITLDGAYIGQYTQLKPLLDAKGYKACFMLSQNDDIDNLNPGYMTKEQLKECEALGWDISSHSGDRVDQMTESELRDRALYKKNWLKNNGFNLNRGGRFFCALQNQWNELAVNVLSEYFHFLRTGNSLTLQGSIENPTLPIFNRKGISDIASVATYDQQVALIQAAARHKQWAVLCWHQPNGAVELTLQQMSDILDMIESLGMEVVTFSDVADDILRLK